LLLGGDFAREKFKLKGRPEGPPPWAMRFRATLTLEFLSRAAPPCKQSRKPASVVVSHVVSQPGQDTTVTFRLIGAK
jgi:hypothetical protein